MKNILAIPSQAQATSKKDKPILCTNNSSNIYKEAFNTQKITNLLKAFILILIIALFFICTPFVNAKAATKGEEITISKFPNDNFRKEVTTYYSVLDAGVYYVDKDLTTINVNGLYISSLEGIQYFPNLEVLFCNNNQLTTLNVSNNLSLRGLDCSNNQLTSLDVLRNPALWALQCSNNQLTLLDVSRNPLLWGLQCYNNQLISLNVSKNYDLWMLGCDGNKLTSLDVSSNSKLRGVECKGNKLTSLDVSSNLLLEELLCYDNKLTSLDLTKNTYLRTADLIYQNAGPLFYIYSDGNYYVNLKNLPHGNLIDMNRVSITNGGLLDVSTGVVKYTSKPTSITYNYDTGNLLISGSILPVTITVVSPPPQTGDNAPIDWMITISIISAFGLAGIVLNGYRSKKYKKEKTC